MEMKEEKLISVIIPVYNSENYLRECLTSIVNQTHQNLEIIVVDDGSTDGSKGICEEFAEADSRFRIISRENGGEAVARNSGLSAATGEFVMFVDSDDVIYPDICEMAAAAIQNFDVLMFDYVMGQTVQKRDSFSLTKVTANSLDEFSMEVWIKSLLGPVKKVPVTSSLNTVWGKLYRRDFLEKNCIFCTPGVVIGTDLLMNLKVLLKRPAVCNLPYTGYFYRYNPASVVHRYNAKIRTSYLRFLSEISRILDEANMTESFQEEVEFQQVNGLLQIFAVDIFHRYNPKTESEKRSDFWELVDSEELGAQIAKQRKNFGVIKRCALVFAQKKWYYPLKLMYLVKDWIGRANRSHGE